MISGAQLTGVVAPLAIEGAVDRPTFESDVGQALAPHLRPEDIVVWDKLKPHEAAGARRAVAGAGARLIPLPPYSPDLSPIKEMFSKVKRFLRSAAARTTETVYEAMGGALRSVCPNDILGWFKSCGLCASQS